MSQPNPTVCGVCIDGVHGACTGWSWDYMSERRTRCACRHDTPEVHDG